MSDPVRVGVIGRMQNEKDRGVIHSFDLIVLELLIGASMTLLDALDEADRIMAE